MVSGPAAVTAGAGVAAGREGAEVDRGGWTVGVTGTVAISGPGVVTVTAGCAAPVVPTRQMQARATTAARAAHDLMAFTLRNSVNESFAYLQILSLIHISEPTRRTPISY